LPGRVVVRTERMERPLTSNVLLERGGGDHLWVWRKPVVDDPCRAFAAQHGQYLRRPRVVAIEARLRRSSKRIFFCVILKYHYAMDRRKHARQVTDV